MHQTRVFIGFLGNFDYDSRTRNFYNTLKTEGYRVEVVCFDWLTEGFSTVKGEVTVYKLTKSGSSLGYYLKFVLLLTYRLLQTKAKIFFAEDVYTLPFIVIAAKLKGGKVFYDSRELYGHLAGLSKRRNIQKALSLIEKTFISSVFKVITTGDMDSNYIQNEYHINNTLVIRNLPVFTPLTEKKNLRELYNIAEGKKILIYQGVVVHGRGLKPVMELLSNSEDYVLLIIGGGEQAEYYKDLAHRMNLNDRVIFIGKVPQSDLINYTAGGDAGVALIENVSLSYYYALPNKLFEYIMAEIPVVASSFPQMKKVIDDYKVGACADPEHAEAIKGAFNRVFSDPENYRNIKNNCSEAAKELNWEIEVKKLFKVLDAI